MPFFVTATSTGPAPTVTVRSTADPLGAMTDTVPSIGFGTKTVPSGPAAIRWVPCATGMLRATPGAPGGMTPTISRLVALSSSAAYNVPSGANAIPETLISVLRAREGRDSPGGITRIPPAP